MLRIIASVCSLTKASEISVRDFKAIVIIGTLLAALLTSSSMIFIISDPGSIDYSERRVGVECSPSPSKVGQNVSISGTGNPIVPVTVLFSQDRENWIKVGKIISDESGRYLTEFTFRSSGVYWIKVICGELATTFRHVVADYFATRDSSGDFLDIQEAIDALPSEGGVVFVKKGVYDLNAELKYPYKQIILRSNLMLIGEGIYRTVIRMFPSKQPIGSRVRMDMTAADGDLQNLYIENLTFVQNGSPDNKGSQALSFRGPQYSIWHNLTNITLRNIKVSDAYGAGISIALGKNILIEGCLIDRTWTGILFSHCQRVQVRNCTVTNCGGDGIFLRKTVKEATIERNYVNNVGDTAIDLTCHVCAPHEKIVVRDNYIKNGRHLRISNARDVQIINNVVVEGNILVDCGRGRPINILVLANHVITNASFGIAFYGARNASALNNAVEMKLPEGGVVQSGIVIAIFGSGLIENNLVIGSANYGISFGGYRLGGSCNITIRGNLLGNFGDIGIWDDGVQQGGVVRIENNILLDLQSPARAQYGIRTDYEPNRWVIAYNHVLAGVIDFISAPNSQLIGNIFTPP